MQIIHNACRRHNEADYILRPTEPHVQPIAAAQTGATTIRDDKRRQVVTSVVISLPTFSRLLRGSSQAPATQR